MACQVLNGSGETLGGFGCISKLDLDTGKISGLRKDQVTSAFGGAIKRCGYSRLEELTICSITIFHEFPKACAIID
jgi:hypothetical protein